jgi:NADH:ubiquinone oxidoreductase subunit 5 (subunit L)/multisubunit Na+/H+ antiporter MnhA subunit
MLGLVIGSSILQIFIFWELVGLCSYLLIGFWYEKSTATNAAMKAFIVNRVGDFGFVIGLGILFYQLGNVSLPQLWTTLGDAGLGHSILLSNGSIFSAKILTLMGIGLFCGAMGKSAQFPLHVWLPDAMEGPTPVSALIHAATMVAAGVYLLGRIFPILTPDAKLFIAVIGCVTLTIGALIAMVQSDIKRVLAFSTISQLGYMMLAMGVVRWVGGLFHLFTHAFFKSLLFLCAGSVIHAARHEREMPRFGGLIRKIPATAVTFLIAVLAISGVGIAGFGFSGYYSKDLILRHAGAFAAAATSAGHSGWYWLLFILPTAVAYLTPFYMTRCWALTFLGQPRDRRLFDHARERPIMWAPLVVLAVLSVIAGGSLLGVRAMLQGAQQESQRYCDELIARQAPAPEMPGTMPPATVTAASVPAAFATLSGATGNGGVTAGGIGSGSGASNDPSPVEAGAVDAAEGAVAGSPRKFHGFDQSWPDEAAPEKDASADSGKSDADDATRAPELATPTSLERGESLVRAFAPWGFIVGIAAGLLMYRNGYAVADRLMAFPPLALIHRWLYRRMYFDELYMLVFVAFTRDLLAGLAGWFDRIVVDGLVNLSAGATQAVSRLAGATDRCVVDGAVNGVAAAARDLGAAARAPQTGRIRTYVTALMIAVAAGAAAAIIVAFAAASGK